VRYKTEDGHMLEEGSKCWVDVDCGCDGPGWGGHITSGMWRQARYVGGVMSLEEGEASHGFVIDEADRPKCPNPKVRYVRKHKIVRVEASVSQPIYWELERMASERGITMNELIRLELSELVRGSVRHGN